MKRILIIISSVIVLGILIFFLFFRSRQPQVEFLFVKKGNIEQIVSVTALVKPVESVDLAFERSGEVKAITVKVGDRVSISQFLVQLDMSELVTQLTEARATVAVQRAKLEELKRGPRAEDITVKETELKKAEQDLLNYYTGVVDVLADAYTKSEDAVRVKTASLFNGYKTGGYRLTFSSCDVQAENDATSLRLSSELGLDKWHEELSVITPTSSHAIFDQALQQAKSYMDVFKNLLDRTNTLLTMGCIINNTSFDTYRTNVSTARTNIVSSITAVNNQEQKIASQKLSIQKIKDELNLKLAGASTEEIASQTAQVAQVEARAQTIQVQIDKSTLRSPIEGVVTKVDVKVGEIAPLNSAVVSVISSDRLEIEARIPEVDIVKVNIGDSVRVTLDAFGNDVVFHAKVVAIEPAETVVEGVATYKTTLLFVREDSRIKSGMTANLDILTDKRDGVLLIPQRAVITKDGEKTVRALQDDGSIKEVVVQTGIRGSDGNIEVLQGLREGEKVIISNIK